MDPEAEETTDMMRPFAHIPERKKGENMVQYKLRVARMKRKKKGQGLSPVPSPRASLSPRHSVSPRPSPRASPNPSPRGSLAPQV